MNRHPANTWLEESGPVTPSTRRPKPGIRRVATIALGTVGVITVAGLTVAGGAVLLDNENDRSAPAQQISSPVLAPATIDTSADASILSCREISTGERTESAGPGDPSSPEGLIVAYEHAFFTARDAAQMAAMSIPSPTVAAEEQLAAAIADLPVDTPWCVSIAPAAEVNNFDVAVRFVEADGLTVTTWRQTMTVMTDAVGAWKIVAVRGN